MEPRHNVGWSSTAHGRNDKTGQTFGRKHEGQGPLTRSTHRCDNIKINVKAKSSNWVQAGSKQSPVEGFLKHHNEQSGSIKGTNFNTTLLLKKAS
jgi:hypothetical protein